MNRQAGYFLGSLFRMICLLFGVSLLSFILVVSAPLDPVTAFVGAESGVSEEQKALVAAYWGLNKTPTERYLTWLKRTLQGDMGMSMTFQAPVARVLAERVAASLVLMFTAWVLSGVLGFGLGVVSGAAEHSVLDKWVKTFCFVLSATPAFWIGLLFLMFFAVYLGWFPIGLSVPIGKAAGDLGRTDPSSDTARPYVERYRRGFHRPAHKAKDHRRFEKRLCDLRSSQRRKPLEYH